MYTVMIRISARAKSCLKYAYLRTLKKENFMIWPTPGGSELAEGIRMKTILKVVPSNITNLRQPLGQSINFYNWYRKMRFKNMLRICLLFWNLCLSLLISVMVTNKRCMYSLKIKERMDSLPAWRTFFATRIFANKHFFALSQI